MLIDCGQGYTATADNVAMPITPASYDAIQIATSANVPVLITRIYASASIVAATLQRLVAMRRSTGSTGGTGVTPKATNGGSVAASCSVNYACVSGTGTPGDFIDAQTWNQFAPYQFDLTPRGILLPVSGFYSLFLPAAPSVQFTMSFTIELIELK